MTKQILEQDDSRSGVSIAASRGLLPEGRDEQFNRVVSFFQERREKWYQRPFVDGFPRYEDYVAGDIGVIVNFQFKPWRQRFESDGDRFAVAFDGHVFDGKGPLGWGRDSHFVDFGDLLRQEKHVVLVPVVDLPAEPDRFVAVSVGAYAIEDYRVDALEGLLYRSLGQNAFHFAPGLCTGQTTFICRIVDSALQAHPTAVKGRAKAENDIASSQGHFDRKFSVVDPYFTSLRIDFDRSGIVLSVDKQIHPLVEQVEFMLGPSHFRAGMDKR